MQVLALARRLVRLAPQLDQQQFRPLVRNYARVSLLAERIYDELKERARIVNEKGEIPPAVESFRRMVSEQRMLAFELGLAPRSANQIPAARTIDLAKLRDEANGNGKQKRSGRSRSFRRIDVRREAMVDAESDNSSDSQ